MKRTFGVRYFTGTLCFILNVSSMLPVCIANASYQTLFTVTAHGYLTLLNENIC